MSSWFSLQNSDLRAGLGKRKELSRESQDNDPKKMRIMAFAKIANALGRNAAVPLQPVPAQVMHMYLALFDAVIKLLSSILSSKSQGLAAVPIPSHRFHFKRPPCSILAM